MKKLSLYIIGLMAVLFSACDSDNISDLRLSGDCAIEALALDNYEGEIDKAARAITVRIPEVYDEKAMTISKLQISDGATCSIAQGETLNMLASKNLHVTNGDVFLDWTLRVVHDEARILSFKINEIYTGVVNEAEKTVSVFVPANVDLTALIPTIQVSENAEISPASGIATDFTQPVEYTVTNNTAKSVYTVTVTAIGKPSAVYAGLAPNMEQLNIEEQTACNWMLANIPNSLYASFDDIRNGTVDLSECKIIWWHFHKDGGVDGKGAFESAAPEAVNAQVALRDYYQGGGSFLLTRYATNLPAFIGAVKNEGCPNNCWGQWEMDAETAGGAWSFNIAGRTDHPLYKDLLSNGNPDEVPCCDAGYRITNSTAQWHIGTDWGGYDSHEVWRNETGGTDLGWGGDGAIVAWEFPAQDGKGGIICIGSGCYDWYSCDPVEESFHENIYRMTKNAFDYLMK